MRYLQTYNERLYLSESVHSVLEFLTNEYSDKVAHLLTELQYKEDLYADSEDVNFLELSKELKMFNFRPANRRSDNEKENYDEQKSVPIRLGRLVKSILGKLDKYLQVTYETEGLIYQNDQPWGSKYAILLLKGHIQFLQLSSTEYGSSKCTIWMDNQEFKADLIPSYNTDVMTLKGIFGPDKVQITRFFLNLNDDLPINVLTRDLVNLKFEPKKIKIELESNFNISDKDIEKFVDRTSAYIKHIRSDSDSKLEIVDGEEIRKWYWDGNYQAPVGELGNSCMASYEAQDFLDLYSQNKGIVSLLILLNKEGKLLGRALVWLLRDGRTFMDRVYTILPSDRYLFYSWAKEKKWAYRVSEIDETYIRYGDTRTTLYGERLDVALDEWKFNTYPYLDTLKILDTSTGTLSSIVPSRKRGLITLNDTAGGYSQYN